VTGAEQAGSAPGRGRLEGRRVLVVGAGTQPSDDPDAPPGNGRAISILAAREGATIACADIDAGLAAATAEAVRAEGGTAVCVEADAADPQESAAMVEESADQLGGLDGLVLNVGIALGPGLAGTSPEDWDRTMAVNVRSHFLACRAALPVMQEGSSIVSISSAAGRRIRANVVVPGLIDTPIGRAASGQNPDRDRIAARVPLGRQGTPWEIAYTTVFPLSGEASYVTGQAIVVDGGLTAL